MREEVVAQAEVERQLSRHAPVVLHVESAEEHPHGGPRVDNTPAVIVRVTQQEARESSPACPVEAGEVGVEDEKAPGSHRIGER